MRQVLRNAFGSWRIEVLALSMGVALLLSAPTMLQAQTCNSDENHYHSGADHCDSGGAGCTVVCI